jgi:DNA-binding PadR family transcriptional regulator
MVSYPQQLIKRAYKEGYIKGYREDNTELRGHPCIMNKLTSKGEQLLAASLHNNGFS